MKKYISLLLVFTFLLTLTACGSDRDPADYIAELLEDSPISGIIESIGGSDSEIHRYSYHVEDCTWPQAFQRAKDNGGYLVRIESQEELAYLIEEIEQLGYQDKYFLLGGRRELSETDYCWVNEDNKLIGDPLNDEDSWAYDLWLSGEPTIEYYGNEEHFMEMHNDPEEGWGWNDVVQNLIGNHSGSIAYIVEYED